MANPTNKTPNKLFAFKLCELPQVGLGLIGLDFWLGWFRWRIQVDSSDGGFRWAVQMDGSGGGFRWPVQVAWW
jgi:hypothetical protein